MKQFLSSVKVFLTTPTFNYLRAMLYVAIPSALAVLVSQDKLSQNSADLWTAVVVAALSPAIASVFAPNGWRTYLFGVAAAAQALLVGVAGANNVWGLLVAAVLGSFVMSGFAAANVHTNNTTPGNA